MKRAVKKYCVSLMMGVFALTGPVAAAGAQQVDDVITDQKTLENENLLPDPGNQYRLGPTDVIEIKVMRHPEVSGRYVINKEGNIQYEFVGDINIDGLNKAEVTDKLVAALEKYIIAPEVTVKIIGYNSKVVYVIGEVGRPGKISLRGDSITVREALVQAGLPTLSAKSAKSVLITPKDDGEPVRRDVDVKKLMFEGDLRENLVMNPGDMLYIPPTTMAKVLRVIQPVTAPITNAAGGARSVTTGF